MFQKEERVGLYVYLYYNRDARKVSKYGDMVYHSRKMRYLLIYIYKEDLAETIELLDRQKFVKRVVPSYQDDIDQNFVGNLWKDDQEKNEQGS